MATLKQQLRELRIYNTHNLVSRYRDEHPGHVAVFVTYRSRSNERSPIGPRYRVVRPGFKTDNQAAWYDEGNKSFSTYSGRTQAREAAVAWAAERYKVPVEDWVPSPANAGDLIPRGIAMYAKRLAREARQAARA